MNIFEKKERIKKLPDFAVEGIRVFIPVPEYC